MEHANSICLSLGLPIDLVLKKPIRGLPGITSLSLIHALISTDTVLAASKLLGYSDNPVKQAIKGLLATKFPTRSREFGVGGAQRDWRLELLLVISHKYCDKCTCILHLDKFGFSSNSTYGKAAACKSCRNFQLKERKEYIKDRTPIWADLSVIKTFYSNCPEGYEVDHIIPLRGTLVSGLHVLDNLQYLTILDNRSKQNKFEI